MPSSSIPEADRDRKDALYLDILGGLAAYFDTPFARDLVATVERFPTADVAHALNKNQVASKMWLVNELVRAAGPRLGTVFVLGGWMGLLSAILLNDARLRLARVVSVDLEPACAPVAESLNRTALLQKRFNALTAAKYDLDYTGTALDRPDTIVNTSCEHLDAFEAWYARIPAGTLLALQSNDMFDEPVHVNCVPDLASFRRQAPMAELFYADALPRKRYTRFMLIGRK
jgi:hypothetical protein